MDARSRVADSLHHAPGRCVSCRRCALFQPDPRHRHAPTRLGRSFRWLLAADHRANLGDGVAIAAGPLLVASQTDDPFPVSMALLAEYLPTLLFGVVAGTVADRFDRRLVVAAVNVVRAIVLALLTVTIATERSKSPSSSSPCSRSARPRPSWIPPGSALVPRLVQREDLGTANARMEGAYLLTNQLIGPPIGAFLFAGRHGPPVRDQRRLLRARRAARDARGARHQGARRGGEGAGFAKEMRDGCDGWAGHAPMRTLALTIFAFNITYGAAFAVLVLYASERLGLGRRGVRPADHRGGDRGDRRDGLVRLARAPLPPRRHHARRPGHRDADTPRARADDLRGGALTLGVFGAHAFVWGTTSTVVRQRAVPDAMLGRVTGIYHVALVGGLVIGTPLGGLLASVYGITAPFWFGFIGSAILVVVLWRQFDLIVQAPAD